MDRRPAIAALALVAESCTGALSPRPPDPDAPPLPAILADTDAFLALIYTVTTKLSLVLKPSAPSYPAAVPLLRDLAQHVSALAHCSRLLRPDVHGATLSKDVGLCVNEVVDALRALVQTFLNHAARGPQLPSSGAPGEEHLVRTATLHDLITAARGPLGIPADNQAAVRKSCKSNMESLDDNLQEIARMVSPAENKNPHDDMADELDDGWDEFGLGHTTSFTEDELARAKNVHLVLRLTTLLHKRILQDILAHPSSAAVSAFDTLLAQSDQLLSTSDDLVAALYAPQEPASVRQDILRISKIATSLRAHVAILLPAIHNLPEQLCALDINDASSVSPTKKGAVKKWFDTCVDQIVRLCTAVSESSTQTETPGRES